MGQCLLMTLSGTVCKIEIIFNSGSTFDSCIAVIIIRDFSRLEAIIYIFRVALIDDTLKPDSYLFMVGH